eukprot:6608554-Heterocapsa_arctica.AAC.1
MARLNIEVDITFLLCFDEHPASWDSMLRYCDNPLKDVLLDYCKVSEIRLNPATLIWTTAGRSPMPFFKK